MKPEKQLIKTIHDIMGNQWVTSQVENLSGIGITPGFSDRVYSCHGSHGFIEFKYRKKWPIRPDAVVKIDHFTKWQKGFLYRHGKHGNGGVFLCLQIENDIMFFDYKRIERIGEYNQNEMLCLCVHHTPLPLDKDEIPIYQSTLIQTLTQY